MAQNITLLGASYSAVPAVQLPKTGGGTARFDDASVTTATASDVASGKVFLASDGTITTGTGGGGGIQKEYIVQDGHFVAGHSLTAITNEVITEEVVDGTPCVQALIQGNNYAGIYADQIANINDYAYGVVEFLGGRTWVSNQYGFIYIDRRTNPPTGTSVISSASTKYIPSPGYLTERTVVVGIPFSNSSILSAYFMINFSGTRNYSGYIYITNMYLVRN